MPGETAIEWTRGDDGSPGRTWNPVTGCTKVSAGCDRCYAERFAERFRGVEGHPYEQGFDLRLWPERLALPLHWRDAKRVFVNSMSDLWHADVPTEFIAQVFAAMALAPRHTFMVLTKRPQRMSRLLNDAAFEGMVGQAAEPLIDAHLSRQERWNHNRRRAAWRPVVASWPLPNVWLGVSVESQDVAWRTDWLARTPARVRFLSCEPLLGPLDLTPWLFPVLDVELGPTGRGSAEPGAAVVDWVIAGGESGPGFRPVDLDWVRALRDQCVLARVPFFYKQQGGIRAKAGGRELDGRTWDEFPKREVSSRWAAQPRTSPIGSATSSA